MDFSFPLTPVLKIQHKENKAIGLMKVRSTETTDPTFHALGYQWVRIHDEYGESMGTHVFFHKAKWEQL